MPLSSALGPAAFAPAGLGFRNLLINGAMQFAQREIYVSGKTTSGYYTADRWQAAISMGTWANSHEGDSPAGSGFRRSFKMTCTTANASPSSTSVCQVIQYLEGQHCQPIKKGTSSAEQLSLSFWVKSNVTGIFNVELNDANNGRFMSRQYTIDASATWEKKTLLFPSDTVGILNNDNQTALYLRFWLASGSAYTTGSVPSSWLPTGANLTQLAPGQTNLAASTSNYWQVTGVQLEIGANATAFDFRPITVEQALCERYYEKSYELGTFPGANDGTGSVSGSQSHAAYTTSWLGFMHNFRVQKRATPTITVWDLVGNINKTHRWALGVLNSNNQAGFIGNIGTSGVLIYSNGGDNASGLAGHFVADAEL